MAGRDAVFDSGLADWINRFAMPLEYEGAGDRDFFYGAAVDCRGGD